MNNTVVYCNDQQHWTVFKGCKQSDFGARMTKLFLEHHSNCTVWQPELYLCITICLTWELCILSYLLFLLMPLHVKERMCVTVLYVKNQQQTWNSHQASVELRTLDQRKWTGSLRMSSHTINLRGALIRASVWIFWAIKIHDGETWAPRTLLMSNSKCIVFIPFSIHMLDPSDPHNVCEHLYETTNGNKTTWVIFLYLCLSVLCVQRPFLATLKRSSECIQVEMAYWSQKGGHFCTLRPEDIGSLKWINPVLFQTKGN